MSVWTSVVVSQSIARCKAILCVLVADAKLRPPLSSSQSSLLLRPAARRTIPDSLATPFIHRQHGRSNLHRSREPSPLTSFVSLPSLTPPSALLPGQHRRSQVVRLSLPSSSVCHELMPVFAAGANARPLSSSLRTRLSPSPCPRMTSGVSPPRV